MRGKTVLAVCTAVLIAGGVVGAQMTPWLQWTLLPKAQRGDRRDRPDGGDDPWK